MAFRLPSQQAPIQVKATFRNRAHATFASSVERMTGAIDAMLADHSARGRLQSGATIIAALRIYEEHSQEALGQALSEAGKLIEHHGRAWAASMDGIEEALEDHLA